MYRIKPRINCLSLLVGVLALSATIGLAQDLTQPKGMEMPGLRETSKQPITKASAGVNLARYTELKGLEVRDSRDVKVGSVDDVVLNSQHDQIDYLAVRHGGFAGFGGEVIAIPWNEINLVSARPETQSGLESLDAPRPATGRAKPGHLTLDVSKDGLDTFKRLGGEAIPRDTEIGQKPVEPAKSAGPLDDQAMTKPADRGAKVMAATENRRLSKLIGAPISLATASALAFAPGDAMRNEASPERQSTMKNPTGLEQSPQTEAPVAESIGKLRDAVINTENGKVAFAFVGLDNIKEHEGELASVPWTSLEISGQDPIHVELKGAAKHTLGSDAFKSGQESAQLERLSDSNFSRRIYTVFEQGPQWEALGYVSPDRSNPAQSTPGRDRSGLNKPQSSDPGSHISPTTGSMPQRY